MASKTSQLESLLQDRSQTIADQLSEISNLKTLIQNSNKQDHVETTETADGEMPEDDYVKMMVNMQQLIQKNTEMQFEIDTLRRDSARKDQVIAGIDISNVLVKIQLIIKELKVEQDYESLMSDVNQEEKTEQFRDQYSLQPHTLVERMKELETKIGSVYDLFSDPNVQSKINQKRKDVQPSLNGKNDKTSHSKKSGKTVDTGMKPKPTEENELLIAEKTRLENYLKVYSQLL